MSTVFLIRILIRGDGNMTAIENLNTNYTALVAKLDEAIALVKTIPANNDEAVQTVADGLAAQTTKIQTVIDSIKS